MKRVLLIALLLSAFLLPSIAFAGLDDWVVPWSSSLQLVGTTYNTDGLGHLTFDRKETGEKFALDFSRPDGCVIYAPCAGELYRYSASTSSITTPGMTSYGYYVMYKPDDFDAYLILAHLEYLDPSLVTRFESGGRRIEKGDRIGFMGKTGRANEVVHLHFEITVPKDQISSVFGYDVPTLMSIGAQGEITDGKAVDKSAKAENNIGKWAAITSDNTNFRSYPSITSGTGNVIKRLNKGDLVYIVDTSQDAEGYVWYHVRESASGSNVYGYIREDMLRFGVSGPSDGTSNAPPSIGDRSASIVVPANPVIVPETPVVIPETPAVVPLSILSAQTKTPQVALSETAHFYVKTSETAVRVEILGSEALPNPLATATSPTTHHAGEKEWDLSWQASVPGEHTVMVRAYAQDGAYVDQEWPYLTFTVEGSSSVTFRDTSSGETRVLFADGEQYYVLLLMPEGVARLLEYGEDSYAGERITYEELGDTLWLHIGGETLTFTREYDGDGYFYKTDGLYLAEEWAFSHEGVYLINVRPVIQDGGYGSQRILGGIAFTFYNGSDRPVSAITFHYGVVDAFGNYAGDATSTADTFSARNMADHDKMNPFTTRSMDTIPPGGTGDVAYLWAGPMLKEHEFSFTPAEVIDVVFQ